MMFISPTTDRVRNLVIVLLVLARALPATAAPRSLPLDPQHAVIGFRAFAFGLVPVDGSFARFHGVLVYDTAAPDRCRVDVTVEVASLALDDATLRDDVLSPTLLDAAAFPILGYSGACQGDGIAGTLTMHGVTRPLALKILREGSNYAAQAALRRFDWGVTGQHLLAGPTVRIRVSTDLPLR